MCELLRELQVLPPVALKGWKAVHAEEMKVERAAKRRVQGLRTSPSHERHAASSKAPLSLML